MKKHLYPLLLLLTCSLSIQVQAQTCVVDAGAPQTICSSAGMVTLNGTANDNVTWTTSGTGTFDDPTLLGATYYPSTADIAAGAVILTLINQASTCTLGPVQDPVVITILPSPNLSVAASDDQMCASEASSLGVSLSGTYSNASSFIWSTGGTGTFYPGASDINTNYTPSAADIASGVMTFAATATAPNSCTRVSTVTVSIIPLPTVSASDFSVCSNNMAYIYLYTSNPDRVLWTGGGSGTLESDPQYNDAWYYSSTADQSLSSLTFTATATGECGTASDQLTLTIDHPITADAGPDQHICFGSGTTSITFNGTVTNTSSVTWYTSGLGTFTDLNNDTTTYIPTATELASNGSGIYFQMDGNSNGACYSNTDYTALYIIDTMTVDPGADRTVCAAQNAVLSATANGATSFSWSSNGTGTWVNQNKLDATYIPSAADRASGSSRLALKGMGVCPYTSDTIVITWDPKVVTLSAGNPYADQCLEYYPLIDKYDSIALNGLVVGISGGATPTSWSIYSGGGYLDDPNNLGTYYHAASTDGSSPVIIVLNGSDGVCGDFTDTATIVFNDPPRPDPLLAMNSPQFGVCKGDTIDLGAYNHTQSVSWSSTGGTGSFFGSTTNNQSAKYVPGPTDVNVTFTVSYVALAGCTSGSSTFISNIHAKPVVSAGSDTAICAPSSTYILDGSPFQTNPAPSTGQTGYWTQEYALSRTSSTERNIGYVQFGDRYDPNSDLRNLQFASESYSTHLSWTVTEHWSDMSNGNSNGGCVNSDTMLFSYLFSPEIEPDTFTALAGVPKTVNLLANDYLDGGLATTISMPNQTSYAGVTSFNTSTGDLVYTNKTIFLNGRDTIRYRLTNTCGAIDTTVIVKLVNGPPFTPDTSTIRDIIQKSPSGITIDTLDLSLVFADYNQNINWSTLTTSANSLISNAAVTVGNPRYIIIVTYSGSSADFIGEDMFNFRVYDTRGLAYDGVYYLDVNPNYEHPAVAPEDFVVINAVSPNGDGVNDFLRIYGISDYKATVVIYNRWSQEVWRGENYDNNNVKFEGVGNVKGLSGPLPDGTYFYVVKNNNPGQNSEKNGLHSGYLELRR